MNDKPSYFAIITADVRYDERLKPNEKILFGEITALSNKDGYCRASNKYFSKLYKVSPETISRWVSNLNKCGYVKPEIVYKEGTKQIIRRRLYPLTNKSIPIDENVNTPIDEKVKGNNTRNNNTSKNKEKTNKKENVDFSEIDPPKNLHIPTWQSWMKYKQQIKKPYRTEQGIKTAMNQLAELSHEQQEACINSSIMNEYQGFFVDKFRGNNNGNSNNQNKRKETTAERTIREAHEDAELLMGDLQGEISEPVDGKARLKLVRPEW